MTRQELIDSLPGDLQPWGALWLPVILRWSQDQLAEFITNAAGMPWDAAYLKIINSMTAEEKVAELKLRKESLQRLNEENAKFVTEQRKLLFSILAKAVLGLAV